MDAVPDDAPEEGGDAAYDALCVERDGISAAVPSTMSGVLAKCRAVIDAGFQEPDGTLCLGDEPSADWAVAVVKDLIRLQGGVA